MEFVMLQIRGNFFNILLVLHPSVSLKELNVHDAEYAIADFQVGDTRQLVDEIDFRNFFMHCLKSRYLFSTDSIDSDG